MAVNDLYILIFIIEKLFKSTLKSDIFIATMSNKRVNVN